MKFQHLPGLLVSALEIFRTFFSCEFEEFHKEIIMKEIKKFKNRSQWRFLSKMLPKHRFLEKPIQSSVTIPIWRIFLIFFSNVTTRLWSTLKFWLLSDTFYFRNKCFFFVIWNPSYFGLLWLYLPEVVFCISASQSRKFCISLMKRLAKFWFHCWIFCRRNLKVE